jgi:hypothetical protein
MLVLDRLCMSLSMIALKTCFSCWPDSVNDIIKFGSASQEKCFLSTILLKNAIMLFEDLIFNGKQKH